MGIQDSPAPLFWYFSESSKEEFASTSIADELVRLFQKQTEHEKKEMIFEVLAPLAENGNMIIFVYENGRSTQLKHILMTGGVFFRTT